MSTNEKDTFSSPKGVIQENRATFHEQLIDKKFSEVCDLTSEILRWPIPRPFLRQRLNRALGTLAWSGKELGESLRTDSRVEAAADTAKQLVTEANRVFETALGFVTPAQTESQAPLDYNAAAETAISVVEHG